MDFFWNQADYTVHTILTMFVDGKFVMLFSMLFGFGMVIMQERAAAKQLNFWGIYFRRLIALFILVVSTLISFGSEIF